MQSKHKMIYFLRGLGVGLFVTGCMFAMNSNRKETISVKDLSKEEIMAAAKDYGMVEGLDAKLNELKNQVQVTPVPTHTPTATKSPETEKVTETESPKKTDSSSDFVQFEIVPGDNGKTVSQKLEDAGIVKSASKFNSYLQKYDHAKKIRIGTFELNQSDSYYEIAIAITGK